MKDRIRTRIVDFLGRTTEEVRVAGMLEKEDCCERILETLRSASLTQKLNEALRYRKSGHFNKAMLLVSEINRDHMTSVRKLQHLFDEFNGNGKREVILRKFRQFLPLEAGIENAPDALHFIPRPETYSRGALGG